MDKYNAILIFLNKINGFGPKTIINLTKKTNKLDDIFTLKKKELKKLGLKNYKINNFLKRKNEFKAANILNSLRNNNVNYLTILDDLYPQKLKNIYDPPPVLFYRGELNFNLPAVAIIGSRNSTIYGRKIASETAAKLAKMGINIVSGFAHGIDSIAHRETLNVESGITTAVLGNGFNYLYPSQNKLLAEKIIKNGLMVSEFDPDTPPKAKNFPRRNRIISALSDLVLVVEAAKKSGTLITVDYALEQGKDIMAVPGNIDRPNSVGCNTLIKKGAAIFTKVADVVDYLNRYLQTEENNPANTFIPKTESLNKLYPKLNAAEIKVLKIFQHEIELYYQDLLRISNLTTENLDRILIKLELLDIIIRLKGKKYQFKGLQNLIKPI